MPAASFVSVATLHPAIRIFLLLFLCGANAKSDHAQLIFTLILLCTGYALGHGGLLLKTLKVFYRLKWLFISILLIYLFLDGGYSREWWPSRLQPGLTRVASLMLLIAAVNLLVQSGSPRQFMSGLLWVMAPLEKLGVPTQRVAVRMALTLEIIPELQEAFAQRIVSSQAKRIRKDMRHYVAGLATLAVEKLELALRHTQKFSGQEIEIERSRAPSLPQFLFLLCVIAVYVSLSQLSW